MAPPDFGRSVNPISTKGGRLCPPNNTGTPGFSDLPTALLTLSISETGHCSIMKNMKFGSNNVCSGQFLKFNDHIKEGRKKGKGSDASPTKLLPFDVVQYGNLVTS